LPTTGGELAVGDQHAGLAVLQHEGDGLGVEPGVQRVEHGAAHRHAEVRLEHGRRVGQHRGHGVADADATPAQGTGQAAATGVGGAPVLAQVAVDDGDAVRVDVRGAFEEAQGRQGHVVGRVPVQPDRVRIGECHGVSCGVRSDQGSPLRTQG
jgi:hypothetical protein